MNLLAIVLCLCCSLCHAAQLAPGPLVMLQTEAVLQTKALDVKQVGAYLLAGQAAMEAAIKKERLAPSGGFIVYAVRQGGLSNVWLDFQPALPPKVEARIIKSVLAIAPFPVASGTALFAAKIKINGGAEPAGNVPDPAAWRAVTATLSEPIGLEELVQRVWP